MSFAAISHLTAGRSQIGTSLSFHLFFAVLGVGLPLMMLVAEGMHLRTGDLVWRAPPPLVTGLLLIALSASAAGIGLPVRGRRATRTVTPAGMATAEQPGTHA